MTDHDRHLPLPRYTRARVGAYPEMTVITCHASSALLDLSRRVARLSPSHRDPEAFHEEKSDIAHALRRLACERRT